MNVGIVGTGYIAGRHATALSEIDGLEIVAFMDTTLEAAETAAKTWGGKAYTSIDDMIAGNKLDAVWVCVPPFAHGELESKLLAKNIPMYIEKPVGTDMDLPSKISDEITAHDGALVTVGYYWRCLEIMPELQKMLQETPPHLVRIAYHGPTAPAPWWRHQKQSGGQVVEQATHLLDTARFLLGEVTVLQATSAHVERQAYPDMDIATSTAALLQFENGLFGTFSTSCVLDSFIDTSIEFICEGRKLTLSLKELKIENSDGAQLLSTGLDPLVLADKAFIAAVQDNDASKLPCPYAEALQTQSLCYTITTKAKEEARV